MDSHHPRVRGWLAVMRFRNRRAAGEQLAPLLADYQDRADVVVLALPRGGVPVAAPVAVYLHAPLDVLIVRKLGAPMQPELAMGAICEGVEVVDDRLVERLGVEKWELDRIVEAERAEQKRRSLRYRGAGAKPLAVVDRTVIVVDDGIATGATMKAACTAIRALNPNDLVIAAPVASPQAVAELQPLADRIICLGTPRRFGAVGYYYDDFGQTTDEEVKRILTELRRT